VLIAGAGDLGRLVADRILQHRELGYQVVGFVDDRAGGDHIGYRGLPLLGTLARWPDCAARAHRSPLCRAGARRALEAARPDGGANRECIDVKVVPDLLQFIALRARLEDLDGCPSSTSTTCRCRASTRGSSGRSTCASPRPPWSVLAVPMRPHRRARALDVTRRGLLPSGAHGLDGRAFTVFKIRSMYENAEDDVGAGVGARRRPAHDARRAAGCAASTLDELPQFWNVLKGDMSIVGPRPERPFFVEQFKHRIPQYMLRHKVKAGITGWAQVNGWRGNTSLEKRIEFDLYYIENWSVTLDIKIMWLTLVRGLFQRSPAV
jgi:hypothetical protein